MTDDITNAERRELTTVDLARASEGKSARPASSDFMSEEQRVARSVRQHDGKRSESEAQGRTVVAGSGSDTDAHFPLFSSTEVQGLRSRWEGVQVHFVDEPRDSVKQADQLVAEAIKNLAETFATERQKLEHQWDRGDEVSTEDLRLSLCRYRSFFERLLSV